jgi:hypothetical protein
MKQKLIALCAAAFLFTACGNDKKTEDGKNVNATTENSSDKKETSNTPPPGPPDSAAMAAMQKAWMDFASPGDMHKWMAKAEGSWEGEISQWMDPAAPPTKTKATEVVKMSMNGLYQMVDFSSEMMGQPMMGHSIMGYDNMKKMFVSSWIDNLGSGIVRMEGTYDEATKTLNMKGKQSDPGQNKETDIRQEFKFTDDNTFVMTMYGTGHDGLTEQKFMEGTFKRKK